MSTPFLAVKTVRNTEYEDPSTGVRSRGQFKVTREKPMAEGIMYFTNQIKRNGELRNEPDGLYTWILKKKRTQTTLIAARTRSKQEVGTLHKNLDDFTPEDGILYAAGEFQKTGDTVVFNLQSGTYMKSIFDRIKDEREKIALRDRYVAEITGEFNRLAGFDSVEFADDGSFAGRPMINAADIITTPGNFAKYSEYLKFIPKEGGARRKTKRLHRRRSRRARSHRKPVCR
jgi:hypothetical protein